MPKGIPVVFGCVFLGALAILFFREVYFAVGPVGLGLVCFIAGSGLGYYVSNEEHKHPPTRR